MPGEVGEIGEVSSHWGTEHTTTGSRCLSCPEAGNWLIHRDPNVRTASIQRPMFADISPPSPSWFDAEDVGTEKERRGAPR